ncbi:universal stress protein [Segnochrobactrum spirostomi]|uniref:Universal stress protein n=1 Tax=Segnochrobactrum spirostomi TaxID=2608987 RepID=A0A6A7Y5W0_9HYPH|nr:universal stress protein [Segnochrobactrum spirostomi]MQT12989.1 universal stress protein [Segnochrobactrum spirostomi]
MQIKDILTIVDLEGARNAVRVALELGERCGAHVTGLAPVSDYIAPAYVGGPIPVELVEDARIDAEDRARDALAAFDGLSTGLRVRTEGATFSLIEGEGSGLVAHGRLTDLAIVGQDDPAALEPSREAVIETLMMEAGAPVLIVPRHFDKGFHLKRVVIAWDGGLPAARAVRAALPVLTFAEEIHVAVIDGERYLPGDPGSDIALHLARHGFEVVVQRLSRGDRSIPATVLDHVSTCGADLVVMGAYAHSPLREFILGGPTRGMMKAMTVPVLMAH